MIQSFRYTCNHSDIIRQHISNHQQQQHICNVNISSTPSSIKYKSYSPTNYIHRLFKLINHHSFAFLIIQMKSNFDLRVSMLKRSGVQPAITTARSFISTPLVNDSLAYADDLRKSRIQNLPNYKKTNLGDNTNFIVVFQTIEIERLANEIELLRVKGKQFERQLFNAQNYEVQIRQLTEKCFSQENQIEEFRDEYEKLNKICQTLYHQNQSLKAKLSEMDFSLKQKYDSEKQKNSELMQEIEKWKNRYQASEKSKSKELEELRNLMESQRKSMIDREIRQMTIRFQNQRSSLESQIRKCRQMLNNRNAEIESLKQKCQKHEITIMESRNYENVINDHENKIVLLSNELMRLSQVLRNKEEDIQNYKKRQYELNIKLKEQKQWEADNRNLRLALEAKIKQIEQWRIRASRLEEQSVRGKELIHYNNELTDKLQLASKQLQRLNNLLKAKLEEIEKWKQKYSSKESELSHYKNLENDVAQYESKINMIRAENDRINSILKARLQEIQVWKKKNGQLQGGLSRMSFIEEDKKILQDKFNHQIKNNQELKFLIQKLQGENKDLRRFQARCRQIEMKNESICNEMQRLNYLIRNKDQELNDNRIKFNRYDNAINEFKNVQIHLKDFENKVALMTQEIDRLNNLIKTKNEDIETLQQQQLQLHSAVIQYKNYEQKIHQNEQLVAKLLNNIEIAKRDIENWQNKFRASEAKGKELQNNLYSNSQQKEKVGNIARTKSQQCQELKNRINVLQGELKKSGQLQTLCEQLHKQSMIYLNELEIMERRAKENENMLNKERNNVQQYKNKLNSASSEFDKRLSEAKNNEGRKSKEFIELQEHYSKLISKVKAKDSQIQMLTTKILQLQSQCGNLMKQFNRLLDAVQKSFQESLGLSQKIQEYQDYARRIHILGAELDRLNKENKHLEEDNKNMRLKYANSMNGEKRQQQFGLITVLMSAEIESLRNRMQQREVTIDEMRRSILQPVRRI